MSVSSKTQATVRQQYLQRLGIVQYVPKQSAGQLVEEVSQEQVSTELELEVEESAGATAILTAMVDADTKRQNAEKERVAEQPSITLAFAMWQAADELLICTAVDDQLPDQQQVTLLSNIVAAITSQPSRLPQFEVINWPPHANMQGDEAEIREYLSTLIMARVDALSTKTLLVLGEGARQWLLNAEQNAQANDGIVAVTDSLAALIVPSLQEMLDNPQYKRSTWGILRRHFKLSS